LKLQEIEVLGSIRGEIDKIRSQGPFCNRWPTMGVQLTNQGQNRKKIEVLRSIIGAIKSNLKRGLK
jgi:hypothetical protein